MSVKESVSLIVREARRASEMKEWVRGKLMQDAEGNGIVVYYSRTWDSPIVASLVSAADKNPVLCDDVTGCCAVGYLDFARVCLAPVVSADEIAVAADDAQTALRQTLWSRDDVKEKVKQAVVDSVSTGELFGEWDADEADQWISDLGIGEGLVPWWNDNVATSREDVQKLIDDTIAMVES